MDSRLRGECDSVHRPVDAVETHDVIAAVSALYRDGKDATARSLRTGTATSGSSTEANIDRVRDLSCGYRAGATTRRRPTPSTGFNAAGRRGKVHS